MINRRLSESEAADEVMTLVHKRHPLWMSNQMVAFTRKVLAEARIYRSKTTFDDDSGRPTYLADDLGAALLHAENAEKLARGNLVAQSFTFGDDGTTPTPFVDEGQIVSTDVPAPIAQQLAELATAARALDEGFATALKAVKKTTTADACGVRKILQVRR